VSRHFVKLSRVWVLIVKYIVFETYFLLAPKCRVGAEERNDVTKKCQKICTPVGTIGK
jgi:hypothetical protein